MKSLRWTVSFVDHKGVNVCNTFQNTETEMYALYVQYLVNSGIIPYIKCEELEGSYWVNN